MALTTDIEAKPSPRRAPAETAIASAVAVFATLIGLILLAWAILFVTKGRFLKHSFENIASRTTQREVRVAGDFQLYLNPINIKFLAEGLTVTNPAWAPRDQFFRSKLIDSSIATIPLIFGTRRFNRLELIDGDLDLEWDGKGKRNTWTFGDPNAKGAPLQIPVIRRALIDGTKLRYVDPVLQLLTDIRFATIRAADTRFQDSIRFSGDGRMRGERFTLSGSLQSPNETAAGGKNKLVAHAEAAGATVLDVSGTLPGATVLEGADLLMKVRGRNLRDLFDFLGVAVPDTRSYRFTSHLTKAGDEWRFTRLAGSFGQSDLGGRMTISMPNERLYIDAALASKSVDLIDVGPFIGYSPVKLDAKGAAGTITQVAGTPRLLPDAPLRVEALRNFDAHVDYTVARIRADKMPISNVALTLDLDRNLLKLSPLTFDLSGGHLASDISINARGKPVLTEYDIRLSPTPMGKLLAGFGVEESGTTGTLKARIQMKGAGDTVHDSLATSDGRIAVILPKGTFWTRNIQLAELDIGTFVQKMFEKKLEKPVQINCGLIAFTVRNGIAAADPILIDTQKNVITGRGGFSFRDESLDFALRADAKTFSVFSGQSPVGVNGHFAAPGINPISPELLTRAGAGLGIAVLANPLAAVLAFVDVGDAKAADCGPVLNGARAIGQRTGKGKPRKDVGKGTTKKD